MNKFFCLIACLLVAFSAAGQICTEIPLLTSEENAGRELLYLEKDVIPNFRRVNTWLYRGGQPSFDKGGLLQLKQKFGVRTIVNLIDTSEPEWQQTVQREREEWTRLTGSSANFIHIPIKNFYVTPTTLDQMFSTVAALKKGRAAGKVYVHCKGGKDRTGLAVATQRIMDSCNPALAYYEYRNLDGQPFRPHTGVTQYLIEKITDTRDPAFYYIPSKTQSLLNFVNELILRGPVYQKWQSQLPEPPQKLSNL